MGKAAIEEVLENLKQLVIHHAHLMPNAVNQTKRLENILTEFKATAVPAPEEWREDEGLSEVIRRIRRAVYAVEDIVDAYVIKANDDNFHDENLPEIADVVEEVESAIDECRCIFQEQTEKSTDFPEFFPEVEDKEQDESEARQHWQKIFSTIQRSGFNSLHTYGCIYRIGSNVAEDARRSGPSAQAD